MKINSPDHPFVGIYYDKIRISYDHPTTVSRAAMIRTNEWKYVARSAGKEELYNLIMDPQELTNLIDDANFKDILDKLRYRLLKWYIDTSDNAPTKKERAL
jgi:arylsulfatase A-like enzyme